MLTDIFAERYSTVPIWQTYGETERRLLVQTFRIVSEQLFPYWTPEGKEREGAKASWKSMHDRLSMELGLQQLAPTGYWAQTKMGGNEHQYWVSSALVQVCNSFVCAAYDPNVPADRFIKERLSFIEIAFRDLARFPATPFNETLISTVEQSAADLGLPVRRMISGAGHDAQMMSRICPTAMVFIPSIGGLSHNPAEFSTEDDIAAVSISSIGGDDPPAEAGPEAGSA